MEHKGYPTQARTIILPITTRGAGFIIRALVCKLARLQIRQLNSSNIHELAGALYRTTLLAIEVKLAAAREHTSVCSSNSSEFLRTDHSIDIMRMLCAMGANFRAITNYIAALGKFTANSIQYLPQIPKEKTVGEINDYDPCYITFSNLRRYAMAMQESKDDTPYDIRKYFYDHSPFPNATWNLTDTYCNVRGPTLSNPDEVMPDKYGLPNMISDIEIITDAVDIVSRKYPYLISDEIIDYYADGNACQLTSCVASPIRCTDIGMKNYGTTDAVTGSCESFWSPNCLTSPEMYRGAVHLYGEVPHKSHHATFATRQYEVAAVTMNCDYRACLSNIIQRRTSSGHHDREKDPTFS